MSNDSVVSAPVYGLKRVQCMALACGGIGGRVIVKVWRPICFQSIYPSFGKQSSLFIKNSKIKF